MPSKNRKPVVDLGHANEGNINNTDLEIEIVNINTPNNEQFESDDHESALDDAWHFINQFRQNFSSENYTTTRKENNYSEYHRKMNEFDSVNDGFYNTSENIRQNKNYCYAEINDFLDALDKSSEDETPNKRNQNYFKNETTEKFCVFDGNMGIAQGPVFIYSYKVMNPSVEMNEDVINSPKKQSPTSSTSTSTENLSEQATKYERNIYRVPASVHPNKIPRLPKFMLPTVTEILEPKRQSPKATEISCEDNISMKKSINSWIVTDKDNTDSTSNNTSEIIRENSVSESSQNTRESFHLQNTTVFVHQQNIPVESDKHNTYLNVLDSASCQNSVKELKVNNSSQSLRNSRSTVLVNSYVKDKLKQNTNEVNVYEDKTDSNIIFMNDSFASKGRSSTPIIFRESFLENNSIPRLHLSQSSDADIKYSCFKRFFSFIPCCNK